MRCWLIIFLLLTMLVNSSGCQSFSDVKKSFGKLPGLKRRGPKQELSDELLDPLGARNTNRLLWEDLSPSQIGTTLRTRGGKKIDESAAAAYYETGISKYAEAVTVMKAEPTGKRHADLFIEAANQFRLAASRYPDSQLEEDALYFEGESFFFADHYVQSNRAFEKLVANYSGTRFLDLAEQRRLAIALYWDELSEQSRGLKLGDPKRPKAGLAGESRRVLHRIRIDDPTGKLADDATLALGKAFLKDKRYYEAADTFEDLRRNYPGSKHQFTAHMLELEARLQGYQGKSYDDTPLRKADELVKTIARQFPDESQKNMEYLEQQHSLIQNQIVERDYSMGKFYEDRGENRSANYIYSNLAKKYDNTDFSATVRQQIAEIEKLPPEPKQHAKWLVDMFPKTEEDRPVIAAGDNESMLLRR